MLGWTQSGSNVCCFLSNTLHIEITAVYFTILRDAFIVLTKDLCIDINFMSLFRCQLLSSFHSSKLTLGGTITQFSADLYFSKIDFILSFTFLLSQFFLILFCNFCICRFFKVKFCLSTTNF